MEKCQCCDNERPLHEYECEITNKKYMLCSLCKVKIHSIDKKAVHHKTQYHTLSEQIGVLENRYHNNKENYKEHCKLLKEMLK